MKNVNIDFGRVKFFSVIYVVVRFILICLFLNFIGVGMRFIFKRRGEYFVVYREFEGIFWGGCLVRWGSKGVGGRGAFR